MKKKDKNAMKPIGRDEKSMIYEDGIVKYTDGETSEREFTPSALERFKRWARLGVSLIIGFAAGAVFTSFSLGANAKETISKTLIKAAKAGAKEGISSQPKKAQDDPRRKKMKTKINILE